MARRSYPGEVFSSPVHPFAPPILPSLPRAVVVAKQLQLGLGPGVAALWITITNITIPIYLRHLCFKREDHVSLNSQQMSLFFKLAFFRW